MLHQLEQAEKFIFLEYFIIEEGYMWGRILNILEQKAREAGKEIEIETHLVKDAMMILIEQGDVETHNRMVLGEVEAAAETCDVVVLAQGSMTVLLPLLGHIQKPVLSSPRLGVERVKEVLGI